MLVETVETPIKFVVAPDVRLWLPNYRLWSTPDSREAAFTKQTTKRSRFYMCECWYDDILVERSATEHVLEDRVYCIFPSGIISEVNVSRLWPISDAEVLKRKLLNG
jgi:hypothetical protein